MLLLIACAAFAATFLGGLFALRLKDKLHLILGFSAGAIIGVAFFDLIPEAFDLGSKLHSFPTISASMALGFFIYLVIDQLLLIHGHADEHRATASAGSLSFHSFLDGVGIGLAFQVSTAVGAVVAAAVLTHDFSDGINTVNLVLKNGGERAKAFRWLIVDAVAPVLGVIATLFFSVPEERLGLLLALFAGFFIYIGASDLIPESHHSHPARWTTIATVLGAAVLYTIIKLASM